ncbi:hypothetical protein EVAR_94022_1 [Eumeta japonica]|uniref:Uncharacterized protein n=1 Tax=Eumeta variegata TaxID=151549 RepID=A0A4C2ABF4_EUMVA|nr:hypothetical protein EVAR_94022_1 [Eumeta japonica]
MKEFILYNIYMGEAAVNKYIGNIQSEKKLILRIHKKLGLQLNKRREPRRTRRRGFDTPVRTAARCARHTASLFCFLPGSGSSGRLVCDMRAVE